MKSLPPHVRAYKRTACFDENTIPRGLMRQHRTRPGVWGRIVVEQGELIYRIKGCDEEIALSPSTPGVVEPEVLHEVAPRGAVRFWVEFLK